MARHDRYDTDILKALQRIASSLDKFVSEIMNLGIAAQELLDEKKKISHD